MIKPLTSLRFFFALMVFLSHLEWVKNPTFVHVYEKVFKEGYVGVNFFFALSGFILALNYGGRIDRKVFYVARFSRIYPLYFFTLLMVFPLELWYAKVNFFDWLLKLSLSTLCLQSFVPIEQYYFSFNWPAWSISTEAFFYAMFPLLIKINFKYKKIILFISIISIVLAMYFVDYQYAHALFYINPVFRLVDFFIGICLYNLYNYKKIVLSRWKWSGLEILSILLFVLFLSLHRDISQVYRYSVYYWLPVAVLLFVFSHQSGIISSLLSNKFLITLGEISFSFYLVHHIIIRYYRTLNEKFNIVNNDILLSLFVFLTSLLISYLTYKYVEVPCNRYFRKRYAEKSEPAIARV